MDKEIIVFYVIFVLLDSLLCFTATRSINLDCFIASAVVGIFVVIIAKRMINNARN